MSLQLYALVMIGGALGSAARYWCSGFFANMVGETFPWGTIIVNIVGSFIIGFFNAVSGPDGRLLVGTETRQFVMVGLCGGYTTFSSFSLQTLNLMRDGEWGSAGANVGLSVALCLIAVWLGHVAATAFNQLQRG
jgi:CrcB protein